jgi:ElaA protein
MSYEWKIKAWKELSANEVYEILALRAAVFVVEQTCAYQDVDGKDMQSLHLFACNEKQKPIAYLRLVEPGVSYDEWSIGRVVTAQEVRHTGVGKSLMQQAIHYTEQNKCGPIRISAQCYLEKFYQSFGFISQGDPYLEDDIPHIEMLRP